MNGKLKYEQLKIGFDNEILNIMSLRGSAIADFELR